MDKKQLTQEERAAHIRALLDQREYAERSHGEVEWPDPRRAEWMLHDRIAQIGAEIARLYTDG